jgi:hypothetical protein
MKTQDVAALPLTARQSRVATLAHRDARKHLGHVASHGCVRLDPRNAKVLYDLVKQVGMQNTRVKLISGRAA